MHSLHVHLQVDGRKCPVAKHEYRGEMVKVRREFPSLESEGVQWMLDLNTMEWGWKVPDAGVTGVTADEIHYEQES